MTIKQKLIVFASSMVLVAMVIATLVSNVVFNNMLTNSAVRYLETASYSAQELLKARREQMHVAISWADEMEGMPTALARRDTAALEEQLRRVIQACPFLAFGMFLDAQGTVLSCMEGLRQDCGVLFQKDLEVMRQEGMAAAYALVPIDALFEESSAARERWDVRLEQQSGTLGQGLISYVGIPIYDGRQLQGYLLVGEMLNHNDYYPEAYSQNVVHSFLTISANTTRVCSNLPESDTHYLGTEIPAVVQQAAAESGNYFGSEQAPIGGNYFFRYQALYDLSGTLVGYIGVGIEEEAYTSMLNVNRLIMLSVMLCLLPFIVLLSGVVSSRIARPITVGSAMAKRIARGDFAVLDEQAIPDQPKSEPEELLQSMQTMAQTLKKNLEDIERYIQALGEMNKQLESMVDARTLELSQTVKALRESNRVKSTFLANVSHELRTPLSSNISTSELLLDEIFGTLNEKQKKYVKNIWLSSTHLLQLINDILDISKIDAGKTKVNLERLLVHDVLEEALTVVKSLAYQKQLQFMVDIVPEDLHVWADRLLLKQVFYNLLSNAIKFSDPSRRIWVSVALEKERGFVRFSIRDEGIGIEERDMERVFREFEQVDNSYSRAYGGTGLGLPLSKKQVELHGGYMELRSIIGQGTEALFWLPLRDEKEEEHGEDTGG